nr:uncharacterized protein LOC129446212 [Misgurnus anguillicaudatus]
MSAPQSPPHLSPFPSAPQSPPHLPPFPSAPQSPPHLPTFPSAAQSPPHLPPFPSAPLSPPPLPPQLALISTCLSPPSPNSFPPSFLLLQPPPPFNPLLMNLSPCDYYMERTPSPITREEADLIEELLGITCDVGKPNDEIEEQPQQDMATEIANTLGFSFLKDLEF